LSFPQTSSQNFANTISARNDLERGLQVKQMDRANYETKLQQVRNLSVQVFAC
jgi:hypothetical protein